MLSGHTHGGQIRLWGRTAYALGFERRMGMLAVHGQEQIGGMRLLVSAGVGVSKLPLRFDAPPEIHLVEFGNNSSEKSFHSRLTRPAP